MVYFLTNPRYKSTNKCSKELSFSSLACYSNDYSHKVPNNYLLIKNGINWQNPNITNFVQFNLHGSSH
jgi:hypothetical protein